MDGILYERIDGTAYEMMRLKDDEIVGYVSRLIKVKKSIYDSVEFESAPERRFAEALESRDDIRLFLKLPAWFTIETPVGRYRPDWAIVKQPEGEEACLYLVHETKATTDPKKLRESEWAKIRCGEAHFKVLEVGFAYGPSPEDV